MCYYLGVEKKPGWDYRFIDSLGMYIAINEKTGVMYTEDKIKYTEEECRLLKRNNFQIPLQVHLIKKVFSGEISAEYADV